MLNQSVLVGRIAKLPDVTNEKGRYITLAVSRNFKNANGEYQTDMLPCLLFSGVVDTTLNYCKVGDIIGVKGRLEEKDENMILVAEKITLLTNKSER